MSNNDFSYANRGIIIRLIYLFVSLIFAILIGFGKFNRGRIVVLCYHAVKSEQKNMFHKQINWISKRLISLLDLDTIDKKNDYVCITFDDAFECLIETVLPITHELNTPIAIFAVTNNFGAQPKWVMNKDRPDREERIMTKQQLLYADNFEHCLIGSHTANHERLGCLSIDRIQNELLESKLILENLLQHEVQYLALPHGSYTNKVIDIAIKTGYKRILTLDEICRPERWPLWTIGRFIVSPNMWMIEFQLTVIGAYAWLFQWRQMIKRIRKLFMSKEVVN